MAQRNRQAQSISDISGSRRQLHDRRRLTIPQMAAATVNIDTDGVVATKIVQKGQTIQFDQPAIILTKHPANGDHDE